MMVVYIWQFTLQELQAEVAKKELALAAIKVRAEELLQSHDQAAPGYKELKKQQRRLG